MFPGLNANPTSMMGMDIGGMGFLRLGMERTLKVMPENAVLRYALMETLSY